EGKRKEALLVYKAARDLGQKLVKDNPSVTEYQNDLARTLFNMGFLRRDMKQFKEALADLGAALTHIAAVLDKDPRYSPAADLLGRVFSNRAVALGALGRHAEAAADWGRFALAAPPQWRALGRLRRALSLARAGQRDQAMKEAQSLARVTRLPAAFLYDL